ncbi:MAG: hypothetical protein ABIK47_07010, partial [candidate division WOR-3 bacterium]
LAEIAYGMAPKTMQERVEALEYKHQEWLNQLPNRVRETLLAIARQFASGGTDELENPHIFEIIKKGGIQALREIGEPREIITETKRRLFAA